MPFRKDEQFSMQPSRLISINMQTYFLVYFKKLDPGYLCSPACLLHLLYFSHLLVSVHLEYLHVIQIRNFCPQNCWHFILDKSLLWNCPVHCRMFPSLCPLDANSTSSSTCDETVSGHPHSGGRGGCVYMHSCFQLKATDKDISNQFASSFFTTKNGAQNMFILIFVQLCKYYH